MLWISILTCKSKMKKNRPKKSVLMIDIDFNLYLIKTHSWIVSNSKIMKTRQNGVLVI